MTGTVSRNIFLCFLFVFILALGNSFAEPYSNKAYKRTASGLFPIQVNERTGYIDKTGRVVIAPSDFVKGGQFSEGLACVAKWPKYGYIDRNGKIAIVPQFDEAYDFSEGLAVVGRESEGAGGMRNYQYGYIDKSGNIVIPIQYSVAHDFSEGRAYVSYEEKGETHSVYIDKNGKVIVSVSSCTGGFDNDYSEGLAVVCSGTLAGYIETAGKYVIAPQFDFSAGHFSGGLAPVRLGKSGYINKDGKVVIAPQFDWAYEFSEGLAAVRQGEQVGYIETNGKMVIPLQFDGNVSPHQFSEGLAAVSVNGKYGYIDKTGVMVIEPKFLTAGDFSEGIAPVSGGYIDTKGDYVWKSSE